MENRQKSEVTHKRWIFTLNNYTDEEILKIQNFSVNYLIYGKEKGESGTPHLQGYVIFKNYRNLLNVKKLSPRAHWEPAKGTSQQNIEYCSKEGETYEVGPRPLSQKRKGEVEMDRWKRARTCAQEGRFDEIDPDIYYRYYRTTKEIYKDNMKKPADLEQLENYWYTGPAGNGKSYLARLKFPGAYFKLCNKWWDGYQNEENVIIDDLDKNHHVLAYHLKLWADKYSFLAETKGGALHIRPRRIIVTSQYTIDQVFTEPAACEAINRRFNTEYIPPYNQNPYPSVSPNYKEI